MTKREAPVYNSYGTEQLCAKESETEMNTEKEPQAIPAKVTTREEQSSFERAQADRKTPAKTSEEEAEALKKLIEKGAKPESTT